MSESPPADPDWYYEKDNRLPVPLDVDEAACTSCGLTLTKGQQSFKFDRFSKSTNEPMNPPWYMCGSCGQRLSHINNSVFAGTGLSCNLDFNVNSVEIGAYVTGHSHSTKHDDQVQHSWGGLEPPEYNWQQLLDWIDDQENSRKLPTNDQHGVTAMHPNDKIREQLLQQIEESRRSVEQLRKIYGDDFLTLASLTLPEYWNRKTEFKSNNEPTSTNED